MSFQVGGSASIMQGTYDARRDYRRDQIVYVPTKRCYAISLTNNNRGNNPETDDGTNWCPLWQRPYPTSIWFGAGQTEALPTANSAFGATSNVNSNGVKSFTGGTADQIESNGVNVTWTNINAETDADVNDVSAPNSVFMLPAGIYHLRGTFYGNQTPDNDVHLRVVEIMSGTDDIERLIGTPRQHNFLGSSSMLDSIYEFRREHLILESDSKFYVRLVNHGSSQAALAGYIQVEKIQ